ncbi:MAG TPA: hypothetical protein VFF16_04185 [Telluria sp.]|nr:hypothetical protein [Telluria sp.]
MAHGVQATMTAENKDGRALVHLRFENAGADPVWVPAAVANDEDLTRREFDIVAEDGAHIDYIGPMVKRGPLSADDYVRIAPHGRLMHTLDITNSYAWKTGTHTYTVRWEGNWLPNVASLGKTEPLAAGPASFNK